MKPILFNLYGSETLFSQLLNKTQYEEGHLTLHTYPDGETSIVFNSDIKDREIIFLATLDRPNTKILPLIFSADTAKSLGATSIGLIAPYLAYMREDKQFAPGGSITSHYFSALLSQHFHWMTTIDPHLHRIHNLNEVYSIPTQVLHVVDPIANWIKQHIENPLIIGPDQESEQWVKNIADKINAPYILLSKNRKGDRDIEVSLPSFENYQKNTPVLVDDIISSGRTMIEPIKQLKKATSCPIICIGVHAIFADNAYQDILNAGASQIVTCNTIAHPSNTIDVSKMMATATHEFLTSLDHTR